MATILLTEQFQRISTIPLDYGELRTYAKLDKQSVQYNNSTYILEARYFTNQAGGVNIGSSTLILDGFNKALGYTTFSQGETKIQEVTRTITHNEDGSCPVINVRTEWYASFGGSGTIDQDITCPKIDRVAKTNDFTGRDVEGTFRVDYTKYIDSFIYKLRISIPDVQRLMLIDNYVSNADVTLDTASIDYIKNYMNTNHRSTCTIGMRVETWDGTTRLSEGNEVKYTCSFVDAEPTFTFTKAETNTKVSNVLGEAIADTIIKSASLLNVVVSPTAYKGSSIASVSVTSNGTIQTITSSPYSFTLPMTTDNFTIQVLDIRGLSTTQVVTMTLLDYIPIKINSFNFVRENPTSSNIEVTLNSDYLQETYNNTPNAPLVRWKLGEEGTINTIPTTEYSIDTTNNKLKLNNSVLTNALSYRQKGTFYIYVSDLFTEASDSDIVIKGIPTWDAGEHDLCVNGTLYVANEDRENKIDVLTKYSTTEKPIGYWTDGEIIYQKVVDTGQIASASKNVAHGISNLGNVIKLYGMARSSGGTYCTLPRTSSALANQIEIQANSNNIVLQVGSSSNFASSFVVIEYTKSS